MRKKILLISNPGEDNDEEYCEGVNKDVENYYEYFTSPLGGGWIDDEFLLLERPTKQKLQTELSNLNNLDYLITIFCGHGYYSSIRNTSMITLRKNENIEYAKLKIGVSKQLIILDSCRKIILENISESYIKKAFKIAGAKLNAEQCRYYYEKRLMDCSNQLIVCYACKKDETAGDSESDGGVYSASLINVAKDWHENLDIDTDEVNIWSIVKTHNEASEAVILESNNTQHPDIDKPRSGPYFPFAVIA